MVELGPKPETACSSPKAIPSCTVSPAALFCIYKAVNPPVRLTSLRASLSALRSVGFKSKCSRTIGALPTCCPPHSGGHLQLGQTCFPGSSTNTSAFLPQGFLCPQGRVGQAGSAGELMYPGATPTNEGQGLAFGEIIMRCVLQSLRGIPRGLEPQLVTAMICSLRCPLLDILPILPGVVSQMNSLHPNLCL